MYYFTVCLESHAIQMYAETKLLHESNTMNLSRNTKLSNVKLWRHEVSHENRPACFFCHLPLYFEAVCAQDQPNHFLPWMKYHALRSLCMGQKDGYAYTPLRKYKIYVCMVFEIFDLKGIFQMSSVQSNNTIELFYGPSLNKIKV